MEAKFKRFIHRIPQDIHSQTRTYISSKLAIFEPESYVLGQEMRFEDYHFILFNSTPPAAKIGNKKYQFKKGSLVSFDIGQDITVLPTSERGPAKYIDITVNKEFFQQVAAEVNRTNGISFKRVETTFSHRLSEFITSFKNEMLLYGESYPLMADIITTQIIVQLLRDINGDLSFRRETTYKDKQSIKTAIDYMQCYYNCGIAIEDICQIVNLSPNYFIRSFKQQTGQTPYQYLTGIRIEKAQQMLTKSSYSVGEIAILCGFVNAGHFATLFKRYLGVSPSEYRKAKNGFIIVE